MEQRISIITLGVKNVEASKCFFEALGWKPSIKSQGEIVFFQAGGIAIALYPKHLLAEDAGVPAASSGFSGVTIAHNVRSKEEVARVLSNAATAGGRIVKPAQDVFWGGHSGYFSDLDGYLWEVAWNPFSKLTPDGQFILEGV